MMMAQYTQLHMLVELYNSIKKNYAITELEALGVVWTVKHFHHYLYRHGCEVYIDHEPLITLLNTPYSSGKLARWGLTLQEVDLVIHYRSRKHNSDADALSRFPVDQNDYRIHFSSYVLPN